MVRGTTQSDLMRYETLCSQRMTPKLEQLVSELKSLNLDYEAVAVTASKTPGKWPFASEAEVNLRRDACRISFNIIQIERRIITELLK